MALKDTWVDKVNEVDDVDADDINEIADAVIEIEEQLESGGGSGEDGATFIPNVSQDGVISWTNDKDKPNPTPVNLVTAVLAALPNGDEVSY